MFGLLGVDLGSCAVGLHLVDSKLRPIGILHVRLGHLKVRFVLVGLGLCDGGVDPVLARTYVF